MNNEFIGNISAGSAAAAFISNCNCIFLNNVVVENENHWGDNALYFANSNINLVNSIIRQNQPSGLLFDTLSSYNVSYCNADTLWTGEGNIDVDPLFRDPENGDFHLMAIECGDPYDSPCIDAGMPSVLDSLLDCDWGLGSERSDMGAYGGGAGAVGIDEPISTIPAEISLSQNYPNPFNASTIIKYELPRQLQVTIEIYDILGRKITTLQDGLQPAGYHQATWPPRTFGRGEDVASGVYFYKLQAGDYIESKKMILVK